MNAIADQSKFDEESASRPHLEAQLERERAEVTRLRRELERAWRVEDDRRDYLREMGVL